MGSIFLAAWFAQSLTGWPAYNEEQVSYGLPTVSWLSYLGTADFWSRTLPELAIGIPGGRFDGRLRDLPETAGSPESKPVGEPRFDRDRG